MDTSLAGVGAKLVRAAEHTETLAAEIKRHPKPVKLWRYPKPDPKDPLNTLWISFRVIGLPQLPERWGAIIGDIAQNLRSVLDYIAWQLGRFNLAGDPHEQTLWPIVKDPKDFPGVRWRIRDLLPAHQDMIEECQPYQRRDREQPFRPLAWLSDLANSDKHRVLTPTLLTPDMPKNARLLSIHGCDWAEPYYLVGLPLELGTDLIRVKVRGAKPDVEVRMNYDFTPVVTFYGALSVEQTLKLIGASVINVSRRFHPILDSPPLGLA